MVRAPRRTPNFITRPCRCVTKCQSAKIRRSGPGGIPPRVIATRRGGWRELSLVLLGSAALTIALTWPLALQLSSQARVDNGDGQFSIWNVAWVARALVRDPIHVFDANIFYPHRRTLLYSESNL